MLIEVVVVGVWEVLGDDDAFVVKIDTKTTRPWLPQNGPGLC